MSSTFEDLSDSISLDEKKALLGKIQASLNLSVKDTDSIISKVDGPEELRHRLTKEAENLGLLERLVLRITGFFRSQAVYEVMAERKLAQTRETLKTRMGSFVHWGREELTPEFAKRVYDLYFDAAALRPVFDQLFQQRLTLEAGVLHLLAEEHPDAAHQLTDLFPADEMARLYRSEQKRGVLQQQLRKKLEVYLMEFPSGVLERVKGRLKPVYYFKHVVNYPFTFLLDLFGHNPDKSDPVKYPYFVGSSWKKAAGYLERLYYGIYLCTKVDWQEGSLNVLVQGVVDRMGDSKGALTVEQVNKHLSSLHTTALELSTRIPWKELLQWSFGDPYYSVKFYLPKFSLKEFYQNTLEMRFLEQLDDLLPQVRQEILTSERATLFQNGNYQPLEYYVPGVGTALGGQHQLKGFRYPEALGMLWGFLNQHFLRKHVPFLQSMGRMLYQANKNLLQPMTNLADDMVNLREKVARFDKSLHPDMEEGKEFQKLKYELATKPTSYKPFIQLVQNKDDQARELVERGIENLQAMATFLFNLREKNIPVVMNVLAMPYLLEGQQEDIAHGLERMLVVLQKTVFILKEAITLES
ncbi:MAG: DUF5312 family protein [Spirochaetales bacterium]